jgi:hypothetical protein
VYHKVIQDAFKAGIENAWDFWHMTPYEINGRIEAYSANLQNKIEQMDTLAWMMGSYNAHAYHDPKKYPRKPSMTKNKVKMGEPMPEESMKDMLEVFALIHNTVEGVK